MPHRLARRLRLLLLLLLLAPLAPAAAASPAATPLVILHTNDLHGQIYPWKGERGDEGGFPALQARLLAERARAFAAGTRLLVTNGGDIFQGTPPGDLTKGEAVRPLFARLGVDAATPGNHDYDYGEANLAALAKGFGCPLLCANLVRRGTRRPPPYLERSRLLDLDGLKVGLTGAMAEDLRDLTSRSGIKNLGILPLRRALPPVIRDLRARGAELVILLSHCGYDVDLATARDIPGLDVILGAHSHTPVTEPALVGRTLIVQAGGNSRYLSRLALEVDEAARRVARARHDLLPIRPADGLNLGMRCAVERAAGPILAPLMPRVGESASPLVHISGPISTPEKEREITDTLRARPDGLRALTPPGGRPFILETNLTQFVCDAFREAAGADLAVSNLTGVRAAIPAGEVRRLEVYNALPFDNTLVAMTLDGADLRALFELPAGAPAIALPQISGGRAFYRIDAAGRWRLERFEAGGRPVEPGRAYRVVTNSFLAQGGDGFEAFLKGRDVKNTGILMRDAVAGRIVKHSPVRAVVEPRLVVETDPAR